MSARGEWVYRAPKKHRCRKPRFAGRPGSVWRCLECAQTWKRNEIDSRWYPWTMKEDA